MASYTYNGRDRSGEFEPSWKSVALKVINDIPSSWNGMSVSVLITSVRRNSPSDNKSSMHYKGLACDLNLVLGGKTVTTGSLVKDHSRCPNPNAIFTAPNGTNYLVKTIYEELLGRAALSNGCRWGGYFTNGGNPRLQFIQGYYDPMHFDGGDAAAQKFNMGTLSESGDALIEYVDMPYQSPSNAVEYDAGNSTRLDSGSPIVSPDKTQLYIGYNLGISDFTTLKGDAPLRDVLTRSGIPTNVIDALAKFNGLKGKPAYELYQSSPTIEITQDNAVSILGTQIQDIIKYLSNNCDINTKNYPTEVSTAIVSYFFGKALSAQENITEISEIRDILKKSRNITTDLARYIESKSVNLPSDVKARRMSEVSLLRGYDPTKSTSASTSIDSTGNAEDYAGEVDRLGTQIDEQKEEIKNLLKSGSLFASDPASSEYDDSFNDIDQSTLDAIASIMQSQQVNSDLFFGFKDKEYVYRIKTKNFYTILSRNLNYKISSVEKLVQEEPMLKNHSEYSLSKMYGMIPYSTGIVYTVKKNAVKRCEYRIRLIEQRIKNNESSLISMGFPSLGSLAENQFFMLTSLTVLGAASFALMELSAKKLFESLSILRQQLKLEKGNLAQLKKDMNRYSG